MSAYLQRDVYEATCRELQALHAKYQVQLREVNSRSDALRVNNDPAMVTQLGEEYLQLSEHLQYMHESIVRVTARVHALGQMVTSPQFQKMLEDQRPIYELMLAEQPRQAEIVEEWMAASQARLSIPEDELRNMSQPIAYPSPKHVEPPLVGPFVACHSYLLPFSFVLGYVLMQSRVSTGFYWVHIGREGTQRRHYTELFQPSLR
jgi:hypothetical protein